MSNLREGLNEQMNILVLGGTRFFGIHLVNSLISKGHSVTIATRGKAADSFGNKVSRLQIERTDPENLKRQLGKQYYDVVCDNLAYCSNDVKYLLDIIQCGRYIMTSSAAVYKNQQLLTAEQEFRPQEYQLEWCSRSDHPYDELKRQAESALFQKCSTIPSVAVRFPYVIGEDDYTKRLLFYVDSIVHGNPINVDNPVEQISFIKSSEAGEFLAWAVEQSFTGPVNANSLGTISLKEVMDYTEAVVGKQAILSSDGTAGPYNGQKSFSLDVSNASSLGFAFSELGQWIHRLLDNYIIQSKA